MTNPAKTIVKQLSDQKWHDRLQCLYIPDTKRHVAEVFRHFENILWVDIKALYKRKQQKTAKKKAKNAPDRRTYKKVCPPAYVNTLKRLGYSRQTIRSYHSCLLDFVNYYAHKDIEQLEYKEIVHFFRALCQQLQDICLLSEYIHQCHQILLRANTQKGKAILCSGTSPEI